MTQSTNTNRLQCQGWIQEAALRLLTNMLSPSTAQKLNDLIVTGYNIKPVRNNESYDVIVHNLKHLKNDQTLLIQSGKPVGIFETHEMAPRILIATANLVPSWSHTRHKLESDQLLIASDFNVSNWTSNGEQDLLIHTYTCFTQLARKTFSQTDLKGKFLLTSGLGKNGFIQPYAAKLAQAITLVVEINKDTLIECVNKNYCDFFVDSLNEALILIEQYKKKEKPVSIGLVGNCVDIYEQILQSNMKPDIVTDQTNIHPLCNSYVPLGLTAEEAASQKQHDIESFKKNTHSSILKHIQTMYAFKKAGSEVFEFGNELRRHAAIQQFEKAYSIKSYRTDYLNPLFEEGYSLMKWFVLSGEQKDLKLLNDTLQKLCPTNIYVKQFAQIVALPNRVNTLPVGYCWLKFNEKQQFIQTVNQLVAQQQLKAPIVFTQEILSASAVAAPYDETEHFKDGSDTIADWPILTALSNISSGASWVSINSTDNNKIFTEHVFVADGTEQAFEKLKRLLINDSYMSVARYSNAGYNRATQTLHKII